MSTPLKIDPSSMALLVIDMQNAFVMPGGSMARVGLSTARGHAIIEPVHRLVDACRKHGLPVIHTYTVFRSDYVDAGLVARRFPALQPLGHIMSGTWDAQIVERLLPRAGEYLIPKSRFNAFYGTNLEIVLRSLGVTSLIAAGVATNVCVESTVREAFIRDIRVILPRDATASYTSEMEAASLATLGFMFADLTTVDDLLSAIEHSPKLPVAEHEQELELVGA
jgi:ureidoacrylate peracid hydrolase